MIISTVFSVPDYQRQKNMLLNQPAAIRHKQAVHSPQKQKIYSYKIKVRQGVIALMATSIAAFGP